MKEEVMNPDDFTVNRSQACRFLQVGNTVMLGLKIPFRRVGRGAIKYRQSDLDKVKKDSIYKPEEG